jgi:hypothetical protein
MATGAVGELGKKGNIYHENTRPRTNPVTPSLRSGVADLDTGPGELTGNHSSRSLARPETTLISDWQH